MYRQDRTTTGKRPSRPAASQTVRTSSSQRRTSSSQGNRVSNSSNHTSGEPMERNDAVRCEKCGSTQIVGGQRGYSVGTAFSGGCLLTILGIIIGFAIGGPIIMLFFMLIGVLTGFSGSSKLVNSCMNCGHKWEPKLRKRKKK